MELLLQKAGVWLVAILAFTATAVGGTAGIGVFLSRVGGTAGIGAFGGF